MSVTARDVVPDVVAFVGALMEGDNTDPPDELLERAMYGALDDLNDAPRDLVTAVMAGIVRALLRRLAGATGRDLDELWQQLARELCAGAIERGEQGGE